MKRAALLVPLLLTATLLAACETMDPPCGGAAITTTSCSPVPAPAVKLDGAQLVEFVADDPGVQFPGAVGDSPIDVGVLRGWVENAPTGPSEPRDPNDAIDVEDVPGMKYVIGSTDNYCRLPTGAELWLQNGDDLQVRFTGGENVADCARNYHSYAQFAVPAEAVAAAAYVDSEKPVDPNGPGVLTNFVPLGVLDRTAGRIEPTRFGWGAAAKMRDKLIAAGAQDNEELRTALPDESEEDSTAMAFVLDGCAEDGAKLVITPAVISAELTGGENTACESAAWFLAVFTVENDYAQWDAELAVYGR